MKSTLIILIGFFICCSLISCGGNNFDDDSNRRHNEGMIRNQKYETELAYNELVKLFGSPNEFKLKEIYSEQIDKIEVYDEAIPRNIFLYYTVSNKNELFCSKFFIENRNVTTIFHNLTKSETEEFEATLKKSDQLTEDVIEGMLETIDSLH